MVDKAAARDPTTGKVRRLQGLGFEPPLAPAPQASFLIGMSQFFIATIQGMRSLRA